jgi:regulator of RNase E activity RraA
MTLVNNINDDTLHGDVTTPRAIPTSWPTYLRVIQVNAYGDVTVILASIQLRSTLQYI